MSEAVTGVSQADYMNLFMMELNYQDPLKPIDNREFMAQMAQFSALESAQESSKALSEIDAMTRANQSLMLLGKEVGLKEDNGAMYEVKGVSFKDGEPKVMLLINGSTEFKSLKDIATVQRNMD